MNQSLTPQTDGALAAALEAAPDETTLYSLLDQAGIGPGWNKPEPSIWLFPKKNFVPAHWSYSVARAAISAAGRFVSTELAERRNLILYNPVPGNAYGTARTLVAAYQMVKSHETARSHRHTPNALRLVIEAAVGSYTVVDGVKIPMAPGDVLLTPNGMWHGHSNESDSQSIWIDFLDVPLVHMLEPMFFEHLDTGVEQTDRVDPHSPMRFAFEDTMRKLDSGSDSILNLGPPFLDTIGLEVWRLQGGSTVRPRRSTANSVFAVINGQGTSRIDESVFHWKHGDVFVAPAWRKIEHSAAEQSHLLRVTDERLLRSLNWLREE
jgi:gentisate 1,2-dioxygenase